MLRIARSPSKNIASWSLMARYQQRVACYSALTITDPLLLYENKVANSTLLRDESQHRAAIEYVLY
jgi:hypothetical protein